jgi:serine/threonine protein phosphatase 1
MKYFVVSDVHSYFKEMLDALYEKGFVLDNKEHKLIICGDLFDRGDKTVKLFEFVKELSAQGRLIYIKGNHEDLLQDCLNDIRAGRVPGGHHFHNGTVKTICQFCGQNEWIIYDPTWRDKICQTMQPILDFIDENCVDYAEIGDYVFVHGWIPSFYHLNDFRDGDWNDWREARWLNGMDMWRNPANRVNGKTIVCGHWHCSWGWSHIRMERKEWPQKNRKDWQKSFEPFVDDGIIALDACTAYSSLVNVLVIEE